MSGEEGEEGEEGRGGVQYTHVTQTHIHIHMHTNTQIVEVTLKQGHDPPRQN